jgi:homoserine kinase
MFTITVPASSANIGPGFDSLGMAVHRYLTLVVEKQNEWEFEHLSPFLPEETDYKKHFIYQVAKQVAEKYEKPLPTCKVIVDSDIPLARGLGSSASAVVAGIELANQLCKLSLTMTDKLDLATEIEGHPDNVAPAILGGLVVSVKSKNGEVDYIQIPNLDLDIVLYIPNVELKTSEARSILPDEFMRDEATSASGISNVMIAALLTTDYELAGKMMEQDLFHEPYRATLIPNYDLIKKKAKEFGVYGTVISGAGPTMISFAPKGNGQLIAEQMNKVLNNYEVTSLQIDYKGLQIQ